MHKQKTEMSSILQKLLRGQFLSLLLLLLWRQGNAPVTDQVQTTQQRKVVSAAVPGSPP